MGSCCVSERDESSEKKGNNNKPQLQTADTRGTVQMHSRMDLRDIDERIKVLQGGNINELEDMIINFDEDINAYVFGQNKTLLLEAVIKCPNYQVVRLIMSLRALRERERRIALRHTSRHYLYQYHLTLSQVYFCSYKVSYEGYLYECGEGGALHRQGAF